MFPGFLWNKQLDPIWDPIVCSMENFPGRGGGGPSAYSLGNL